MMQRLLNQQSHSLKKQTGATLMGMLFIGILLVFVALIGLKLFPAYQQFFSVKSIIRSMKSEVGTMSKSEIMSSFDKRADAGYVTVITGKDLVISKGADGDTVVTARYQVVTPILGNVSALMDFETSTDSKL
jgi:hypothetical protein